MSCAMSRAAPQSCNTIAKTCFCSWMSVLKHHNAISLVQWRKEYDDSMFALHERGCFVVATETPPWS
eukprot:9341083-Lingulodinium_polyedra.AAC.1